MQRAFEVEVTDPYVGMLDAAIKRHSDQQRSKSRPIHSAMMWVSLILQILGWVSLFALFYIVLFVPLSVKKWVRRRNEKDEAQNVSARMHEEVTAAADRPIKPFQVGRFSGCRVIIWSDEHPPPHFHVEFQGEEASFSILTCDRLRGTTGLKRYEKQVRAWWKDNKSNLVQTWNATRPTDCPVGPIIS